MYRFLSKANPVDFKGKNVIVRVDFNVPLENGVVTGDKKLRESAATVKFLVEAGAKVILISHLGRPKGVEAKYSLLPIVDVFGALIGQRIHFAKDVFDAEKDIDMVKNGEVILLENLRFYQGEEDNDRRFYIKLASYADIYVNEAFSCSHRTHGSIVGVASLLKSYAGFGLEKEISTLEKMFSGNTGGKIFGIIGGSKVSTKLKLLNNLIYKMKYIAICGGMANTFLYAMGYNVGKSLCETELKQDCLDIIQNAKAAGCELVLPQDVMVSKEFKKYAESRILNVKDLSKIRMDEMILDVGMRTVYDMSQKIKECQFVVWNGPLGVFEMEPFNVGTDMLAREIALLTTEGTLESVIGGGDTALAIERTMLSSSFSYISTGGGAFLEWLEGYDLPGVTALQIKA